MKTVITFLFLNFLVYTSIAQVTPNLPKDAKVEGMIVGLNNRMPLNNELIVFKSHKNGNDYNINGDLFAGHIAGALSAAQYIILTDVDGLMLDKDNPDSIIHELKVAEINQLKEIKCIQGGMIPKIDSCEIALNLQ